MFDDVMDGSETRRGAPCWYKQEDVKLIALNDALMIENAIYMILKEYFGHTKYYMNLVDMFHEVNMTLQFKKLWEII